MVSVVGSVAAHVLSGFWILGARLVVVEHAGTLADAEAATEPAEIVLMLEDVLPDTADEL